MKKKSEKRKLWESIEKKKIMGIDRKKEKQQMQGL